MPVDVRAGASCRSASSRRAASRASARGRRRSASSTNAPFAAELRGTRSEPRRPGHVDDLRQVRVDAGDERRSCRRPWPRRSGSRRPPRRRAPSRRPARPCSSADRRCRPITRVVGRRTARRRRSTNEDLKPWPSTATNVISARPIISAAAVEAVRDGLRIAFWRASCPAAPPKRAPGAPSTSASGRTSRGAIMRHADEQQQDAGHERRRSAP